MMNMVNILPEPKYVQGNIQRKELPRKSAVEYADHALNAVVGCAHNCDYCYGKSQGKFYGDIKSDEEWVQPRLVSNTLELMKEKIPKLPQGTTVHLSFMTDPFMYCYPQVRDLSLSAIALLNSHGIKCTVLTKGILPLELAQFSSENEYGITVTCMDQSYCDRMEPGAAPVAYRIASLKALHDMNCKTWVSVEPLPFPGMGPDTLDQILEAVSFVDRIIFGKVNHYKGCMQHQEFYLAKSQQVIDFCRAHGIDYLIKKESPKNMCLALERQ